MIKTKLTVLALALSLAGVANAEPFYIDAGVYGTTANVPGVSDTNTQTPSLDSLGWNDSVATSIYLANGTVIDTNNATTLGLYGITPVANPVDRLIETLNPTPVDGENFTVQFAKWGNSAYSPDGGLPWGMTYTYELVGAINGSGGVDFTSGYFDLFFENGTTSEQLIRLNLSNFSLVSGGAALYTVLASGNATFNWDADPESDASVFAQNFFNETEYGRSFYDVWFNNGNVNPIAIAWRMDNNIDCPQGQPNCYGIPLPSQLTPIVMNDQVIGGYRQTTVDGTVRFDVPEPGSLALLGLGLAGLGFVGRRRKQA